MKLRSLLVSSALLLYAFADRSSSRNKDPSGRQCENTNCTKQPDTICSDLLGRGSDYTSPQQLPPEARLDESSLSTSSIILNVILQETQSPPACHEFALHLLCLVAAPPCNQTTQTPLLLCPETCHVYEKLFFSGLCDRFVDSVIRNRQSSTNSNFTELVPYFKAFNCSDPASYFQNDITDECADTTTSSCTHLFSPETEAQILGRESLFRCDVSAGSLCQALFPNAFVYSIQIPGRVESESEVFEVLSNVSPFLDRMCSDWLNLVACNYLHPFCTNNGKQMIICDGQCPQLNRFIDEQCNLKDVLMSAHYMSNNSFLDTLLRFNCSDPQTYLVPGVPVDNTTCYDIMSLITIPTTNSGQSISTAQYVAIVVGSLVGGVVLTAAVAIVCVRVRSRRKWRKASISQATLSHFTLRGRATHQLRDINSLSVDGRWRSNVNNVSSASPPDTASRSDTGLSQGQYPMMIKTLPLDDHDGENELKAISLSPTERESYEREFAGSLVEFSSLNVGRCVGEGAFGKVYSGSMTIEGTRTVVAIKTIKRISSEDELSAFLAESLIMKDFKHPHVLGLEGVCFDTPDGSPYIILPFMSNGSVKTYLKERRVHPTNFDSCPTGLKMADLVQMCMDIAEGMKYLTLQKFVHRDLAARNCMVNEEGAVLVGDFGLARDVYAADYYRSSASTRLPVKWMPPETLNDGISNEKTDMWSYGVTCWEVFSLGRSPYPGIENHEILQHISNGGRLKKPTLCPDKLYALLLQCWYPLPEDRPTFEELGLLLKEYWDDEHLYVVQSFNTHQQTKQTSSII